MFKFYFLGIFIQAIPSSYLPASCTVNITTATSFRECVNNNGTTFIEKIYFKTYKQMVYMNLFHVYDIILPAPGSLRYGYGDNLTIPTFELNSSYGYQVYLFDPKFQMPFRNPLIVPRTSLKILANLTYFEVNIKVKIF